MTSLRDLGHFQSHARNVSLVLNPKTGLVSPQFHVVIDDDFSTVPSLRAGTMPDNWQQLVCNSREKSTDGFYDITKTWLTEEEDISADTATNQAIESANSCPNENRYNLPQA